MADTSILYQLKFSALNAYICCSPRCCFASRLVNSVIKLKHTVIDISQEFSYGFQAIMIFADISLSELTQISVFILNCNFTIRKYL